MSFDFIDRKFRKPETEANKPTVVTGLWWCDNCGEEVGAQHVRFGLTHASCGHPCEPSCGVCDNAGFVETYSQRPPAFKVCEACHNPFEHRSP